MSQLSKLISPVSHSAFGNYKLLIDFTVAEVVKVSPVAWRHSLATTVEAPLLRLHWYICLFLIVVSWISMTLKKSRCAHVSKGFSTYCVTWHWCKNKLLTFLDGVCQFIRHVFRLFFWPLLCTSTSVTMRYYHCRTNDVSPQKSTVSNFFLLDYFMEFIVFKAEGSYLQALDPCQKRLHMNYSVLFSWLKVCGISLYRRKVSFWCCTLFSLRWLSQIGIIPLRSDCSRESTCILLMPF